MPRPLEPLPLPPPIPEIHLRVRAFGELWAYDGPLPPPGARRLRTRGPRGGGQ